jgi:poly(hydroxyalkanoate) depolymerase family esterase
MNRALFSLVRLTPLALVLTASIAACEGPIDPNDATTNANEELTAVSSFGANPGALNMYVYSPAGVPDNAPLVLALHGCTQSASDYTNVGWNELADIYKFHVVYPEQVTANNQNKCFNWFQTGDITRGSGEAESIAEMVAYMKSHAHVDPARVYITGLSAGAAMTNVMLATYPDVFSAGAIMSGLPYECATTVGDAYQCMNPGMDKTPTAWGNLVRAAAPSGTQAWPRVSIWHGQSDTTVAPKNGTEMVEEWTNVHGIDATADATETVSGATHTSYSGANNAPQVELWSIPNMAHGTAIDPGFAPAGGCGHAGAYILDVNLCSTWYAARFFGIVTDANSPTTSSSAVSTSASSGGGSASSSSASTSGAGGGTNNPSPYSCTEINASVWAHVLAGRAVRCGVGGSYVCAVGSNINFGLWTLMPSTLAETAPGYYVPGNCP